VTTNGALLLDATRDHLARFVAFPSDAVRDIATLWAAGTHCVGIDERLAFNTYPRIGFISDLPGSGKTSALERTLALSFRGELVLSPTPMSFCTMVSERRSTPGIDELDNLIGAGSAKMELRGILNAGYRKGQTWTRGKQAPMPVFAAVGFAGLGARYRVAVELGPLRQRTFNIEMQPAIPDEEYWEDDHGALTAHYRDQLTAWCKRNLREILAQRPAMPAGIEGRMKEISHPLIQLATVAGGHWPDTARQAVSQLLLGEMAEDDTQDLSLHERLLLDLRTVYGDAPKMPTSEITDALYALPASTWSAVWPNRNKASRELAMMLRPLGVEPTALRLGNETHNGYHRYMLEPLWDEMITDANKIDSVGAISGSTISLDDDEMADAYDIA
jgi:hypothetical protein